jgi:hypothetical protein
MFSLNLVVSISLFLQSTDLPSLSNSFKTSFHNKAVFVFPCASELLADACKSLAKEFLLVLAARPINCSTFNLLAIPCHNALLLPLAL